MCVVVMPEGATIDRRPLNLDRISKFLGVRHTDVPLPHRLALFAVRGLSLDEMIY
jgi:hypothetical protein